MTWMMQEIDDLRDGWSRRLMNYEMNGVGDEWRMRWMSYEIDEL